MLHRVVSSIRETRILDVGGGGDSKHLWNVSQFLQDYTGFSGNVPMT
jgi:hypothetical protein